MSGMRAGKRFERKFREAMEPHGYVLRIPDAVRAVGERIVGEETDADFIVATGRGTYLVECKAVNRPRLEFYNVKEHQEHALAAFDAIGDRCHGFLAVEFYSPEGYRKPHRAFLLPIGEWTRFKSVSDRRSMPMSAFEDMGVEMPYERGGYLFDGEWFARKRMEGGER